MKRSKIQWCHHTFNGWIGCTKVSCGCIFCYAENETFPRVQRANGKELWGKGKPRHRTSAAYWNEPLAWDRDAAATGTRPRVFCASLSDWLDDEVPIEWLADLLKLIYHTPNLDWLLLTKRPENWRDRIEQVLILANGGDPTDKEWLVRNGETFPANDFAHWLNEWTGGNAPANIWLGTSVEDQPRADERIPELEKIPAKIHFLSVEPMLDKISFPRLDGIDWAIFGGESGPHARPCNIEWIRDGVKQCQAAGVAPFVKQLGGNPKHCPSNARVRFGIGPLALTDKKGGDMSEWPEDLRVREFPNPQSAIRNPQC